jgi:hypothetical protein
MEPTIPKNPSDKTEVSVITGIDPNDLEEKGNKVYVSERVTEKVAKKLFGTDDVRTHSLPIFKATVTPVGEVGAVTLKVRGSELLANFADEVNLIGMVSKNTGEFLNYTGSKTGEDGEFTVLFEGQVYDGEIDKGESYELLVFIKDGGIYDLDRRANGEVISSVSVASGTTDDKNSSSGCNEGYGFMVLAMLGALPFVTRKNNVEK